MIMRRAAFANRIRRRIVVCSDTLMMWIRLPGAHAPCPGRRRRDLVGLLVECGDPGSMVSSPPAAEQPREQAGYKRYVGLWE